MAPALVKRYGKDTDSDATDAMVAAPLMFGNSRGGPNSLRPGFTGDGHVVPTDLGPDGRLPASEVGREHGAKPMLPVRPGNLVAAPLTKGSATGDGVNPPGRRQEDDVNIVAFDTYNQTTDAVSQTLRDPNGTFGDALPAVVSFDAEYSNQAALGDDKAVLTRKLRRAISSPETGVRRLTPTECERLQGFPDGWTQLGSTPDSRRYAALGDAVTVNVAEWIGRRLAAA